MVKQQSSMDDGKFMTEEDIKNASSGQSIDPNATAGMSEISPNYDSLPKLIEDLENKLKSKLASEDQTAAQYDVITQNTKASLTFWYPHKNAGNRPPLNGTSDITNPKCDLEKYGAYHFQIYMYPNELSTEQAKSDEAINQSLAANDKLREDALKNPESAETDVGIGGRLVNFFVSEATQFVNTIIDVGSNVKAFSNVQSADIEKKMNGGDLVNQATMRTYIGKNNVRADIYLPLSDYKTERDSGIASTNGVANQISVALLKVGIDTLINGPIGLGAIIKTPMQNAGVSFRDFKAPRPNSPSLETQKLQWKLYPRSVKEMEHIINILRFFQISSIVHYDKGSIFYRMPPVMYMEVLTHNHTNPKKGKTTLKPKRQYYITNLAVAYSSNDQGSVLLTPEGYPFFIELSVALIKADITTYNELFVYPFM